MNNKDLILQYVDTGLRLPEHQVIKLPNWGKKTYIRKRIISRDNLAYYEISLLDDLAFKEYFEAISRQDFTKLLNGTLDFEIDILFAKYIKIIKVTNDNFHFEPVLEYILDDKRDDFIILYLKYKINSLERHEVSNIIMNSTKPEQFAKLLFANEHVLSITNGNIIQYLDKRLGIIQFLKLWDNNHRIKLCDIIISADNVENHIRELITKNLIYLKYDDDNINDKIITTLLYSYKDEGTKILIKSLTEKKIASIFSNIEAYADSDALEPISMKLAIKYGSIDDPRLKFSEIYNIIIKDNHYGEDGKYIEFDILEHPLPTWAKDMNIGAGFMYSDSTIKNDIYGLSKKEVLQLIKKQIRKVFNVMED